MRSDTALVLLAPFSRALLDSPVWKEHGQGRTLKGSISTVASGQQREGSHCALGMAAGLAAFSWLKRSIL